MRARVSPSQLMERLANVPRCLVGMEAGAGAHHIARCLVELGHDVQLIPAHYVKPLLKGHKNDYRDAEAIIEAVQRPTQWRSSPCVRSEVQPPTPAVGCA